MSKISLWKQTFEMSNLVNITCLNCISSETYVLEHRTGEDRTGEDKTGEDRTGEDRTGEDRTGEDRTGEDRTDSLSKPEGKCPKCKKNFYEFQKCKQLSTETQK